MSNFLTELVQVVGADCVLTGKDIPERHFTDWSGTSPTQPLALVRPRSTAEVSTLLALCSEHRVPVVPQGGLTGLAGAAVPCAHGVALSLDRMHGIDSVDVRARTLAVQAGATLAAVQEAASSVGLLFGVDFGARGSCHMGGAIATNAGGNGVLQHGMMREQVLGIEVVLADGTVLPMLRPMLKNNTGYDLKQFFIGAEGTLGVITRALVRLRPLPAARITALVALPDFDAALSLLGHLQVHFAGTLAAFELMWRDFVAASLAWQQLREPFNDVHPFIALIEVGGQDQAVLHASLEQVLSEAIAAGQANDAVIAQAHAQATALWKIREATAELTVHMRPPINFDVSLPMAEIGHFADACRAAIGARWPDNHTIFFGHVGDGNLHITTDAHTVNGEQDALEALVYERVSAYRGSVSAEHGIGLHKKPHLSASRTSNELATMRAIKRALDPLNLLNPGKVFDL